MGTVRGECRTGQVSLLAVVNSALAQVTCLCHRPGHRFPTDPPTPALVPQMDQSLWSGHRDIKPEQDIPASQDSSLRVIVWPLGLSRTHTLSSFSPRVFPHVFPPSRRFSPPCLSNSSSCFRSEFTKLFFLEAYCAPM